jgi:hypothetical protein
MTPVRIQRSRVKGCSAPIATESRPITPVRLQRKRTKGFRLTSPNGLPILCVSRPSRWGNPVSVSPSMSIEHVVEFYGRYLENLIRNYRPNCDPQYRGLNVADLRGCNLACWCGLCPKHAAGKPFDELCADCAPCHADPLGVAANRRTT